MSIEPLIATKRGEGIDSQRSEVEELSGALLAHIEEHCDQAWIFTTPEFSLPQGAPPKKVAQTPPRAKIIPGVQLHAITPTPILLIYHDEGTELLIRLAQALSKKKAPAQAVAASSLSQVLLKSPLVKLLALTPRAKEVLGEVKTHANIHLMDSPETYAENPPLRQPLWDALCARI